MEHQPPALPEALAVVRRICPGIDPRTADLWARCLCGEGEFVREQNAWQFETEGLRYGVWSVFRRLGEGKWQIEAAGGYFWRWEETILGHTAEERSQLFLTAEDALGDLLTRLERSLPEEAAHLRHLMGTGVDWY